MIEGSIKSGDAQKGYKSSYRLIQSYFFYEKSYV